MTTTFFLMSTMLILLFNERGFLLAYKYSENQISLYRHYQHHHHKILNKHTLHQRHTRHHHQQNYFGSNSRNHTDTIITRPTTSTLPDIIYSSSLLQQRTVTTSPDKNTNNRYEHSEFQAQHSERTKRNYNYRLPNKDIRNYKAPETIKTEAIYPQDLSLAPQNNRIDTHQDLYAMVSVSNALNYGDYDYEGEQKKEDTKTDYGKNKQHRSDFTNAAYKDHEYTRVIRDQSHFNYHQLYDDYVNDQPTKTVPNFTFNEKPGLLTEQKFRDLGTHDAVYRTREKYFQEQSGQNRSITTTIETPLELALDHLRRMTISTRCKTPMPRVVQVSNETSKSYNPRAVILHRCGEDTGCCVPPGQICSVKSYDNVELYFFVVNLENQMTTARLTLKNHTECHCVDRRLLTENLLQPRAKRSGQRRLLPNFDIIALNDKNVGSAIESAASCRCPKGFDTVEEDLKQAATSTIKTLTHTAHSDTLKCRCDCHQSTSSKSPCQRRKDGEESFDINDRKCIYHHECNRPTCSFGQYDQINGRCPSKYKRIVSPHNFRYG